MSFGGKVWPHENVGANGPMTMTVWMRIDEDNVLDPSQSHLPLTLARSASNDIAIIFHHHHQAYQPPIADSLPTMASSRKQSNL